MNGPYKAPVNYRNTPSRTTTPEVFTISGGIALLAEAPTDPTVLPLVVTVDGSSRTRVDVEPAAGQYRIQTQTVYGADAQPHLEYLPLLEFHSSDEGLSGTVEYYRTGTILTHHFFAMLIAFLTPIMGAADADELAALYPPTSDQSQRGRSGDTAMTPDGVYYFSNGSEWIAVTGGGSRSAKMTLAQALDLAVDAGYEAPSFADSVALDAQNFDLSLDGNFVPPGSYIGDLTLAEVFDLTLDAIQAEVGDTTVAGTFGVTADATAAEVGGLTIAGTFGVTADALLDYAGSLTVSETLALTMDAVYVALNGAATFAATLSLSSDGTWAGGSSGITFVAAGALAGDYGDTGISIVTPAGIADGDILICHLFDESGSGQGSTPSGWTALAGNDLQGGLFWKRKSGSQASVAFSNGNMDGQIFGRMYAFRGCIGSGSPIDVETGANWGAGSGSPATGAALTTSVNNAMIAFFLANAGASNVYSTLGGSIDTRAVTSNTDNCGYKATPANTAGIQAAPTIAFAGTIGSNSHKHTIALKPA